MSNIPTKQKGTRDLFDKEQLLFEKVREILFDVSKKYGFKQITFPTFESIDLFKRSSGENSEVVSKEMYSFTDKGDREIALRPEGTASAVRLVLENKLIEQNEKQRLFYFGSMFRYERPQKGRFREFYQLGVESFNDNSVYHDIEIIDFATEILKQLEITQYKLHINSIGSIETRTKYTNELKKYCLKNISRFSEDAKVKIETNILRVLDSKDENDILVLKDCPKIIEYLNTQEKERFETILINLKQSNIPYTIDYSLVRGLDYYNDLVFEFISTSNELGVKSTIIGGGRYDKLVTVFDNSKNIPAIGFAIGIERLIETSRSFLESKVFQKIDYYVATTDIKYNNVAIKVAKRFREKGNIVIIDFDDKKFSKKIEKASKLNSSNIIIVGEETEKSLITIKNLITGKETTQNI